jgi:hypothetical protein
MGEGANVAKRNSRKDRSQSFRSVASRSSPPSGCPLGRIRVLFRFLCLLPIALPTGCARRAPAAPVGLFEDVAAASGLQFTHSNGGTGQFWMIEVTGSGCAFFDYDNDGFPDVFLVQSGPLPGSPGVRRNGLHHNVGGRGAPRFVNVTEGSGLEDAGYGQGVAVGDYDNDGFEDVFITGYGGNHLYRNLGGTGRFEDVTRRAGLSDTEGGPRYATAAAFGDYDNDGLLDLYVCHYCPWTPAQNKVCHDTRHQRDYCAPDVYDPAPHRLYHNLGGGRFEDVSRSSGIGKARGRGLAVAWVDFDGDGREDIYVADDMTPNLLWHNLGGGRFQEIAVEAGCAFSESGTPLSGMGIGVGDYDNDGREDFFVTNFSGQPNSLYRNAGQGRFEDVSMASGVALPHMKFLSFGCEFFDYDADGWRDLIVANGHVQLRVESNFDGVSYAERKQLFHNDAGHFAEVTAKLGDLARPTVSRGLAVADVDNDGGLDFLVNNQNGPAQLFMNRAPRGHWISFKTVGTRSNHDGRHARITITAGGRRQTTEVRSGSSFASHSDPRVYFGLGAASRVDRVEIRWPSGVRDTARELPADAIYLATEGRGMAPTAAK